MHRFKTNNVSTFQDELTADSDGKSLNQPGLFDRPSNELGRASLDLLRMKWFSTLGEEPNARITVPFDDLIEHIEDSFDLELLHTEELRLAAAARIADNLEDVMLAVACTHDDRTAWFLLERELSPLLARMCELRVDETDAMLHSSRFLRTVEARTRDEERLEIFSTETGDDFYPHDGTPCLQDYTGLHSLRSFLGGPLFAILQDQIRDGLIEAIQPAPERDRGTRRLRLAD